MMKKHILFSFIAAAFLSGCNDSSLSGSDGINPGITDSLNADTKVKFDLLSDPSNPQLVLPTFLAHTDSDGTLSTEGSGTDLSDPKVAMGTVDGWSTSTPIAIEFSGDKLLKTTAAIAFHLVEVSNPQAGKLSVKRVLEEGIGNDYLLQATDTTLIAIPLKPLKPQSHYMFAVTNKLQDIDGNKVGTTLSYSTLKSSQPLTGSVAKLENARKVTAGIEAVMGKVFQVKSTDIVYSSWFTTGSVGEPLKAMKAALTNGLNGSFKDVWSNEPNGLYEFGNTTASYPLNVALVCDLTAKEFVFKPSASDSILNTPDPDTGISANQQIRGLCSSVNYWSALPADEQQKLVTSYEATSAAAFISEAYTKANYAVNVSRGTVKLPYFLKTDSTWNTTPFAQSTPQSLPELRETHDVPYILFAPETPINAGQVELVIYQHGITSAKENAYSFAWQQIAIAASKGKDLAVIAIDQPLHGERPKGVATSANVDATAFLNLAYLPVARDNLRQSAMDVLGLRAALTQSSKLPSTFANIADLKTSPPVLYGHSMGGITGLTAAGIANLPSQDSDDALFKFNKVVAANTGGDIANLILGSDFFGPIVKHSLVSKEFASTYGPFIKSSCQQDQLKTDEEKANNVTLAPLEVAGRCFTKFFAQSSTSEQAAMVSLFNQFAFAAQTVVSSVDPINTLSTFDNTGSRSNVLKYTSTPVMVVQSAADDTVPNSVSTAPLAGTTPMALSILGIDGSGSDQFEKLAKPAVHSTVIAPSAPTTAANPIPADTAIWQSANKTIAEFISQ